MKFDLSVVIAVWNQEKYIQQAIESTFSNKSKIEIVVLDDGSTDNTWDILTKIECPKNIKLVTLKQQHSGMMGETLHKLYLTATGKYIVELGSDDYFLPEALDQLLKVANDNPNAGLIYSGYYQDRSGAITGPIPDPSNSYYHWKGNPELRLLQNNFVTPPCAVKRSLYGKVTYDKTQEINEDYLFKLELSRVTDFYQIKKPLAVLRIRADSISNNPQTKDKMRFWENEARRKVIEKYGR